MKPACLLVASFLTLASSSAIGAPAWGQETEPFLTPPHGPYRGQVVDLLSEKPIEGALVLIAWSMLEESGDRRGVAFRELLTDASGRFVLDTAAIEARLPPRSLAPRVVIYKPGYGIFPREVRHPVGAPAARFTGTGGVVRLRSLRHEEDRVEAFNAFTRALEWLPRPPGVPLTATLRLVDQELRHFGIEPVPPSAKPGGTP
jgi:hypothetical protein